MPCTPSVDMSDAAARCPRHGRRHLLTRTASGLGAAALASLLRGEGTTPHHTPKAKRVIYLFQSGGPSQMDLFDYKPRLARLRARRSCPTRSAWASGSRA